MIMRGEVRTRIPAVGLAAIALVAVATLPRWSIAESAADAPASAEESAAKPSQPLQIEAEADTDFAKEAQADPAVSATPPAAESPRAAPNENAIDVSTPKTTLGVTVVEVSPDPAPMSDATGVSDAERIAKLEAQLKAVLAKLKSLEEQNPQVVIDSTGVERRIGPNEFRRPRGAGRIGAVSPTGRGSAPIAAAVAPSKPTADRRMSHDPHSANVRSGGYGAIIGRPSFTFTRSGDPSDPRLDGDVEAVTMIRATYKLPKGTAAPLAEMFSKLLGTEIEFRVKGDALQVTASSDDQAAISHLIRLIQRQHRTLDPQVPEPAAPPTY